MIANTMYNETVPLITNTGSMPHLAQAYFTMLLIMQYWQSSSSTLHMDVLDPCAMRVMHQVILSGLPSFPMVRKHELPPSSL